RGIVHQTVDKVRNSETMRASARVQLWPGKLTAAGSVDYDVENKNLVQTAARLRYDVQCCGFMAEMIKSKYNVDDTTFRFNIGLANIGSMGSFLGQDATRR